MNTTPLTAQDLNEIARRAGLFMVYISIRAVRAEDKIDVEILTRVFWLFHIINIALREIPDQSQIHVNHQIANALLPGLKRRIRYSHQTLQEFNPTISPTQSQITPQQLPKALNVSIRVPRIEETNSNTSIQCVSEWIIALTTELKNPNLSYNFHIKLKIVFHLLHLIHQLLKYKHLDHPLSRNTHIPELNLSLVPYQIQILD